MKRIISVALALVMIFALAATFAAKDSPSGDEYYLITVTYEPSDGSLGTAKGDKDKVKVGSEGDDSTVTLTAEKKNNGEFTGWTIDGKYEIVSGSLTSETLVIRPLSDIKAVAKFTKPGTPDSSSSKQSGNEDKTSPKTGDPLWIVLGLAVLALGAGALAVKKIKE